MNSTLLNSTRSTSCWLAIAGATLVGTCAYAATATETGESLGSQLLDDLDPNQFAPPAATPEPAPSTSRQPKRVFPGIADEILGEDVSQPSAASPLVRVKQNMDTAKSLLANADSIHCAPPVQRQVVADLDALIEQLAKQCCSGGGQSSGQPKPGSQRSQAASGKSGTKPGRGAAPARDSTPQLRPGKSQAESLAERDALLKNLWGHLPPHVREQMLQAHSDEFLPQYELEIEAYFRRLAEDAEPANAD